MAEVISIMIPNQRLDRVVDFLRQLETRISIIEQDVLKKNKYFVDLLEDAIAQSSRSMSSERNKYIAVFLEKNREISESSHSMKKKLLHALEELTDEDVKILISISEGDYYLAERDYSSRRKSIREVADMTVEEKYVYEMSLATWMAHINSMERLDILKAVREIPHTLEQSTGVDHIDDETGLPKVKRYIVSDFGKLLVSSISERVSA